MKEAVIVSLEHDVVDRLEEFGVTKNDLGTVAKHVATARNLATPLHPTNAPGTFAYHEGVRSMRELFISQQDGWEHASLKGIEVVLNKKKNLVIAFQNVDQACSASLPKAISEKRISSKQLIQSNTLPLFPEITGKKHQNRSVWYLCVSSNGDDVRMELSKPEEIDERGQFSEFSERIFIVSEDDAEAIEADESTSDEKYEVDDFEIQVTKKV